LATDLRGAFTLALGVYVLPHASTREYVLTPAARADHGEPFWRAYLTRPHAVILECAKSNVDISEEE
jgi:hypothetical protein